MSATPPPAINCFMPWDLAPGVIVAVALQQVDGSPDAETGTESYYEGLQYGDCAVEKCHKCVPPCFLRPEHEKNVENKAFLLYLQRSSISVRDAIRTRDLPLRRRTLYPAELRKHICHAGSCPLLLTQWSYYTSFFLSVVLNLPV